MQQMEEGRHMHRADRMEACMQQMEKSRGMHGADREGKACMQQMMKDRRMHGAKGGRRVINEIQRNNPHSNNKGPQSLILLFPKPAAF